MGRYVVGVDVGGTNIKLGLVDRGIKVIDRTEFATKSFISDRKLLIQAIVDQVNRLLTKNGIKNKDVQGIGIGLPGLVDALKGVVHVLPNIPGWKNVALKKILESKLYLPVWLENDVNLITLGEWKHGAGRGFDHLVCLTLGTGVGSGLILDGRIYRGVGFSAGELGHVPINEEGPECGCGGYGCLESYVGNKRLLQRAQQIFKRDDITLEELNALASDGNQAALEFWQETAVHIGNALVGVVNMLNPQRIVIGGGVSNNYKFLFKTIETVIRQRAMKTPASMVKITRAKLGNDAGIIGAYVLVNNQK